MADKSLSQLIINKLTKAQYDALPSHSADELWFITGSDYTVTSASYATTASYAMNGGGGGAYLPITGGVITGSLYINGALGQGGTGQGQAVTASGEYSHAQGAGAIARAIGSHAEGYITVAHGQYSHAEGNQTISSGSYSHAEGYKTNAVASYQTVVGKLNILDSTGKYVFIVGAGTESDPSQSGNQETRRNAFAVKSDGNIDMIQGAVLNGTASYALKAAEAENVAEVSASFAATIDDNERVTAASLNDLNGKVGGDVVYAAVSSNISLSGVTGYSVPVSNSYQKHFILFNTSTATRTITLPTGSTTHSLDASIDIDAKSYGEVNIMKANDELWVRAI